ncbi:MAG: tetratricopeptide repeat protein [Bacteroides sp.]|nr:tetratricopeptide repeat protein [Bacteroides sp.]
MKRITLISLIISSILSISAQTPKVDSLIQVLNTQKRSTAEQLKLYEQIGTGLVFNNPDQVIGYMNTALPLARKEKDIPLQAYFYELLGIAHGLKTQKDSSIIYLEKSLDLARLSRDERHQTYLYINLGASYQQENPMKALECYMQALPMSEKIGDKKSQSMILGNIGSIHLQLRNPTRAIYYLEQGEAISEEIDFPTGKIRAYNDLASVYQQKQEYEKAMQYGLKSVELCREVGNLNFESTSLCLLATIHSKLGNYDKALEYAREGLTAAEKLGDTNKLTNALKVLSGVYLREKRYSECETTALRAWQLDSTTLHLAPTLAFNISMANIFLGNPEKAAHFLRKNEELNALVSDENYQETLMVTEVKYETEKKEMRIASLEKERQLYIWLGLAGVLLAITFGIVLWQKIKSVQKEKQLVASNAVQEGEMAERERIAAELHDRLLGTLSALKSEMADTTVVQKLDDCIEEVRRITHNLMPLSLRFGIKPALEDIIAQFHSVQFHFFGEEKRIGKRLEFTLYCCANELITNSIRHSGAQHINVQLIQGESHVSLTVQDDGRGFKESSVVKGIGLKNIRDRVASCNGKIDIFSSPGKGTETIIELSHGKDS